MDLEEEVAALKARLERLEATVDRLIGEAPTAAEPDPTEPFDHTQLRAWLRAQSIISDPSPLEQEAAERWQALPEEEKRRLRFELDHLPPGPMVSEPIEMTAATFEAVLEQAQRLTPDDQMRLIETLEDICERNHFSTDDAQLTITTVDQIDSQTTAWDVLDSLAGSVDAPVDWASQHDHYLYGNPKRRIETGE